MTNIIKPLIASCMMLMTSFTFGRVSSVHAAPPVFWNVFDATVNKNNVLLKWEVTEYNNKTFYIQHSLNGNDWRVVDSVKSKNSPFSLEEYTYTHINNRGGRQFYRMAQIDIDMNRTGYSKVVTVILEGTGEDIDKPGISFSPNPATDQVRITNNDGTDNYYSSVKIFDLSGKMVISKRLDGHSNTINIPDLPTGVYLARVECYNGKIFTQKLIKQ